AGLGHEAIVFDAAPGELVDFGRLPLRPGGSFSLRIKGPPGFSGQAVVSLVTYPEGEPVVLSPNPIQRRVTVEVQVPPGRLDQRPLESGRYLLAVDAPGCERFDRLIDLQDGRKTIVQADLLRKVR